MRLQSLLSSGACAGNVATSLITFTPLRRWHLRAFFSPEKPSLSCRLVHCAAEPPATPPAQRPPRFYIPEPLSGTSSGTMLRLPLEEARHATRTLRLKEGSRIEVCDGCGATATAEIAGVDKAGALVRLVTAAEMAPREEWEWTLAVACGSLKGGRGDWLIEKSAELGAAAVLPLLSERSPQIGGGSGSGGSGGEYGARKNEEKKGLRKESQLKEKDAGETGREARWGRVATSAMKQCLRTRSLNILPAAGVDTLCALCLSADVAFVGVEGARPIQEVASRVSAVLPPRQIQKGGDTPGPGQPQPQPQPQPQSRQGVLIIGPEGDFTADEVRRLTEAGAVGVGLGNLRLRTETAALALLSFASLAFAGVDGDGSGNGVGEL